MNDQPFPARASLDRASARLARRLKHRLCQAGMLLALVALVAALVSALGWRLGLWSFSVGFEILFGAVGGALLAALLSLAGLLWPGEPGKRQGLQAGTGLAIGLLVASYPLSLVAVARSVPPIHDITTDMEQPPAFVAVPPLRTGASNETAYGGPAIARLQRQAYPDIGPLRLAAPPGKVFDAALATVKAFDWALVAADPSEGRIEATDTSFWFHFKDDVVLRIAAEGTGTRVDMRSTSRLGRSDLGVNARRIRRFLAALTARLPD